MAWQLANRGTLVALLSLFEGVVLHDLVSVQSVSFQLKRYWFNGSCKSCDFSVIVISILAMILEILIINPH